MLFGQWSVGGVLFMLAIVALGWGMTRYGRWIGRQTSFRWYGQVFNAQQTKRLQWAWIIGGWAVMLIGVIIPMLGMSGMQF